MYCTNNVLLYQALVEPTASFGSTRAIRNGLDLADLTGRGALVNELIDRKQESAASLPYEISVPILPK